MFASVLKMGQRREEKNEKEEIIASVQKRGETKEERIIFRRKEARLFEKKSKI